MSFTAPTFAAELLSLIPDTAAGTVRVPNMPEFCKAWKTTTLSALANDESMKAFVDAQRIRAEQEMLAADLNVGIKLRDLLEIASGEAVLAWLPFKDARRPFSLAVVADTRGLKAEAQKAIDQVDADLKAGGATRNDVKYGADTIRVYALKPKPGQIKIEQVAIMLNDERIIASDRDSVVTSLLDAVAGKSTVPKLVDSEDYKHILRELGERQAAAKNGQDAGANVGVMGLEWFARPIAMARIIKDAVGVDRGRQVNVLNLLERQGFDAIRAAGGQLTIGHRDYDLLHHGFVLAPPVTSEPSKYKLAARMLQFPNAKNEPIPAWVGDQIASYTRLNWNMDEAFWAAETLVNDAVGDEIFRDVFDGIRDDEDGPKIDVAKNVIPNLGEHLIMLTDNELPVSETSERLLVAIEVTDVAALRDAVKRAMEVEPDATLIEGVQGAEVYRVLRSDEPADFDAELFDDLGLGEEPDPNAPPPLLNQWAITVAAEPGQSRGYLVFSSHPELLIETAGRILSTPDKGLGDTDEFKQVGTKLVEIGGQEFAGHRMVRLDHSLRVKYALLREGKLRDSDSLLASVFRRTFEKFEDEGDDPLGAKKLPPFAEVEKYFRPAGTVIRTVKDGWLLDGFLLK
ncbi:MAG: membrane or secreted protein [Planctomycetaceae bacterium]